MASPGAVQTARGPVAPAELGPTLAHEHVFCDFYRVTGNLDHLLNDDAMTIANPARVRAW
jgi:predicted metal-dependent phosphotriesterase family hydrolase